MFNFLKKKEKDPKEELRKILGDHSLPSFPNVVMEILSKLREPNVSTSEIADLIALDPKLTVELLRTANSAGFSSRRKIETVNQAIGVLGFTHLESLVLSIAVGGTIPRETCTGFEFKRFWKACCRRGVTARALARILCPTKDAECFSAGFLQDLAIPFIVHGKVEQYGPILEQWHSGADSPLPSLEQEALGWNHAEVATFILNEWDLPESLALSISGHHNGHTGEQRCPPPVLLVGYLGETDANSGVEELVEKGSTDYGIPREKLVKLLEQCFEDADEFASLMF